jgi:hypothetical protein
MNTQQQTPPPIPNATPPRKAILLPLGVVLILLILGVPCALSQTASSREPTLQIQGAFSMIDRSGKESRWTDFTVSVSGTKYRILNNYFNGELLMAGSDGTNSYYLNKFANMLGSAWESGWVSAGQFPAKDETAGQLCWLAFAARNYFVTNTHAALPLEGFQENAEFLRSDVTLSARQPRLPRLVKWYGSNFWHSASATVPLPYAQGFVAGEFVVTSTTNCESLELPSTLEMKFFIPSFTGSTLAQTNVALAQTLRGRVISVKAVGNIDDFRPKLGAKAQIVDFRFPAGFGRDLLLIDVLNGQWPRPGDTKLRVAGVHPISK